MYVKWIVYGIIGILIIFFPLRLCVFLKSSFEPKKFWYFSDDWSQHIFSIALLLCAMCVYMLFTYLKIYSKELETWNENRFIISYTYPRISQVTCITVHHILLSSSSSLCWSEGELKESQLLLLGLVPALPLALFALLRSNRPAGLDALKHKDCL